MRAKRQSLLQLANLKRIERREIFLRKKQKILNGINNLILDSVFLACEDTLSLLCVYHSEGVRPGWGRRCEPLWFRVRCGWSNSGDVREQLLGQYRQCTVIASMLRCSH